MPPRIYPDEPTALVPMAVRVTKLQSQRLGALRNADGMSAQEHIRRALDEYIDRKEKSLRAQGVDVSQLIDRPPRPRPVAALR